MTVRQALFIAPCSHVFHYKCLRPLLEQHHPGFMCPVCRTFADLDEDVEIDHEDSVDQDDDDAEIEAAIKASAESSAVATPEVDVSMMNFDDAEHDRHPKVGEETEVENEFGAGGSSSRARGTGSRRVRQQERWSDIYTELPRQAPQRPRSNGSAEDMTGIAEDMVGVLSSGSDPEDIPGSWRVSRRGGAVIKDN